MLILPLLFVLIPTPQPSAEVLMNFSRLTKALGQEILLVDRNGVVRQGRLVTAAADAATMEFASGTQVFSREEIASVTRLEDSSRDGLIKGMVFGAVLGLYVNAEFDGEEPVSLLFKTTATYGAIGWALDAVNKNAQPIYRVKPSTPNPTVKLSFRF